jgi:biopolymer transport protein ExbB
MIAAALHSIRNLVDLGGPVVVVLMLMSVVVTAIVLWKIVAFEIEGVGRGVGQGFVGHVLREAFADSTKTADFRARLHARLESEFGRISVGLRVLDLTAQVAPLLGLFGTVLGMIAAFRTLQDAGGTADPSVLAGGIWVALITTAAGLVVAMPTAVLLSWLDSRIEAHRRLANEAIEHMLSPRVYGSEASPNDVSLLHVG